LTTGTSVGAEVGGCAATVGKTGSAWDAGGEVGVLSTPQAANIKTKTVDMIPNVQLRFNFILGTPEDKLGFQFPRFVF
jgi:hypothetical protein